MQTYDATRFPKSIAATLPVPSRDTFGWRQPLVGVLGLKHTVATYSGRHALAMAIAHAGIRSGDRVLLPAYHCLGMVEPLRKAGIETIYYPIRADLTADPDILETLVGSDAKALIVVHYFGFIMNLSALRRLTDRAGLVLIEDCAHACFGSVQDHPVGSVGDYAIASTQKFFPIPHGGLLASARRDLSDIRLPLPPLAMELKAAVNLIEKSIEYDRLGSVGRLFGRLLRSKDSLLRKIRSYRASLTKQTSYSEIEAHEYAMNPRWLAWRATRVSTFLMHRTKTDPLIRRRRAYYSRYLHALAGRSDCRPLFDALPDGVVPQVFPLYVQLSLEVFVALKRQGVPIIRFGEFLDTPVTPELCPVSVDYSAHVLQFPCHQELRETEVDWILECLVAALDQASGCR